MSLLPLAATDSSEFISGIISLVIFLLIFVNAIRVMAKKAREEQEAQKRRAAQKGLPDVTGPVRPAAADEVQSFLDDLARQAGMPIAQRPRQAPPEPAKPSQEMAAEGAPLRQAAMPPRARPARPRQPTARPQRRSEMPVETVRRPARKRPASRYVAPKAEKTKPHGVVTEQRPYVPPEDKLPEMAAPSKPSAQTGGAAERLESLLPKAPLRRAVMLRDLLGPCRAVNPYGPFSR